MLKFEVYKIGYAMEKCVVGKHQHKHETYIAVETLVVRDRDAGDSFSICGKIL